MPVKLNWRLALFLASVVVPMVVIMAYLLLIASDQYVSEGSIIISEERSSSSNVDLSFLGLSNSAADNDALVLKSFVLSKDMLAFLNEKLSIRAHYGAGKIDYVSKLDGDATAEEFFEYYQDKVFVEYDREAKLLTLTVRAFDRKFAQDMVQKIIERSEEFIDALNDKISREQLRFFETELVRSERKLQKIKAQLVAFQYRHRIFSTEAEGETIIATISALETQVAQKQSELKGKLTFASDTSPQVVALRTEISALKAQIDSEKERLTGGGSISLAQIDSEYREIKLNAEFVTNLYKSNLSALEAARIEAARKLKFLIVVSEPSLADESEHPDEVYIGITALLVCLMLFAISSVVIAIIREHR
ncbi:MAG: hypothetical protein ACR2PM_10200 [Hyphomicrobiales bacterium]